MCEKSKSWHVLCGCLQTIYDADSFGGCKLLEAISNIVSPSGLIKEKVMICAKTVFNLACMAHKSMCMSMVSNLDQIYACSLCDRDKFRWAGTHQRIHAVVVKITARDADEGVGNG